MTDNYTKEAFLVDGGLSVNAYFTASGAISPRRPVYATGNLKVNQTINDSELYAGIAAYSGAEGDAFAVYRGPGTYKVYITGAGNTGDGVVATGITSAAAFKSVKHGAAYSGSAVTSLYASGLNVVGELLQESADGDLSLVYFYK